MLHIQTIRVASLKQWLQVSIQVMKTNFSQETLDEYPEGVQ
jgi:hypothetical protein